ncbi:MAG: MarR family transcriptional regulator [Anaerolineales bacterium]|nr:MAG: MarR family transcriptional regulator [Anaerolineales bacterium]
MLNQLLALLREGGTRSIADLARELDATPQLVEAMLEQLAAQGYLARVENGCDRQCGSCPVEKACATGDGGRVWSLAE